MWWRRVRVPKQVRSRLALERDERVLAGHRDERGSWWVGTNNALHYPQDDGFRRLPWERIDRVAWDRETEQLRVTEAASFGEPMPAVTSHMPSAPRRLLGLIRERVTASIVVNRHVPLYGERGVRVLARRRPGTDDPLAWSVAFDEGLEPSDSDVQAKAEWALEHLRTQVEPG